MRLLVYYLIFLVLLGLFNLYTIPEQRSYLQGFVGQGDSECFESMESKSVTTVCHIPLCTKLQSSSWSSKEKWVVNCTCDCSDYTLFRNGNLSIECLQIYAQFSPNATYKPGALCLCEGDTGCSSLVNSHPEYHSVLDFLFLIGMILLAIYAAFQCWGRSFTVTCCGIQFQLP